MTIPGLIGGIILLAIALFAIALPFWQQRRNQNRDLETALSQKERDELLTDYERVLATIRDLDEDHQTGKLAPDTYQRERSYWTEQGILLLRKLEPDTESDEMVSDDEDQMFDDAIEAAIAKYRQAQV